MIEIGKETNATRRKEQFLPGKKRRHNPKKRAEYRVQSSSLITFTHYGIQYCLCLIAGRSRVTVVFQSHGTLNQPHNISHVCSKLATRSRTYDTIPASCSLAGLEHMQSLMTEGYGSLIVVKRHNSHLIAILGNSGPLIHRSNNLSFVVVKFYEMYSAST